MSFTGLRAVRQPRQTVLPRRLVHQGSGRAGLLNGCSVQTAPTFPPAQPVLASGEGRVGLDQIPHILNPRANQGSKRRRRHAQNLRSAAEMFKPLIAREVT